MFKLETEELETVEVSDKRADMHIMELALAWVPRAKDAEGSSRTATSVWAHACRFGSSDIT